MNLIVEIGGTNARFSTAEIGYPSGLLHIKVAPCDQFESVEHAITWYLAEIRLGGVDRVCLAIAGPAEGPLYTITNRSWTVDPVSLRRVTGASCVEVINDFTALALAIPHLCEGDLCLVRNGRHRDSSPKLVLGPGTGMGMAALMRSNDSWQVLPSEGGNIGFSPKGELEISVFNYLQQSLGRVIIEDLLSGSGIELIYQTLCYIYSIKPRNLNAVEITNYALANSDPQCIDAVDLFCGVLGEFTGDMSLVLGASGGVYLGGGILPCIKPILLDSSFTNRFSSKRKVGQIVADIPIWLITASEPALIGASHLIGESDA